MPSKLERDIEEVLARIDRFPPKRPLWSRVRRRLGAIFADIGQRLSALPRPRLSVGQVLLLGILIVVVAYVFGSGSLVRLAIIAGILLFAGAFIVSLRRQSGSRLPEKRWRGEPMDVDEGEPGSWWRRWRSRR